jgi:hypothetical protein
MAMLVFIMSSDVLGAYQQHRTAAKELGDIRRRLAVSDSHGYPLPDVLLAMTDYSAAVEGAPESVPWAYEWYATELDARWKQYQEDREAARGARQP